MAASMLLTWATALTLYAAAQGQDAGYSGFTTNFGGSPSSSFLLSLGTAKLRKVETFRREKIPMHARWTTKSSLNAAVCCRRACV